MKKPKLGFTLLELMIIIALIGVIIIGITKLNFNSLSDKQRLDGFFYKIKTNIETTRNNTLTGKEVRINIGTSNEKTIISNKWKIDFNNSGSGSIKTYYYDGINYEIQSSKNIIPEKYYSIITKCVKLNNTSENLLTDTGSIIIEGGNLSFTGGGSCGPTRKVLKIEVKYRDKIKKITINTISGVIEE